MINSKVIEFRDVDFSYGDLKVINGLSISINQGEFVCLTGKSGCGKSTLLRLINGLLERQNGEIKVLSKDISKWEIHQFRRKTGYVIQEGALFPHLTAFQNMAYCMKLNGYSIQECKARVDELLSFVDLDKEVLTKFPNELSGGQRQRVGILRAIAHNPEIVLMDEPFSALDEETRISLQNLVKNIHNKLNTTFVMVTHSKDEANKLASRVIHMKEGKIT